MKANNNNPSPEALLKALEDAKKILETSAQTNRNLFIAFNSVLITVLILCLSVTDEMLLLGSSTIKLPLLNVDLPIWAFATIAPLALVALHFDLLQNLSAHREKLIAWCLCWFNVNPSPSRNADMTRQLYPFLFDYAWIYNNHIESPSIGERLLPRLGWLLYCWGAYTVLVIFFVRFAELQHYGYTSWHLLLLIFDALILYWYWLGFTQGTKLTAWKLVLAIVVAPLSLIPHWGGKVLNRLKLSRTKILFLWFSNLVALWTLLLFTLIQVHIDCDKLPTWIDCGNSPRLVEWALGKEAEIGDTIGLNLVPRLTLHDFRLTLPDKFFVLDKLQQPDKTESQLWQEKTNKPQNLSGRRLAFVDFDNAQLPHIDLSSAKLHGASLWSAVLQGVNLEDAQLQGAYLNEAHLEGVNLEKAHLEDAYLEKTQLKGAKLNSVFMQGAHLSEAHLEGVELVDAHLEGADLSKAHLEGTTGAVHLQGANLAYSYLQVAYLRGANLNGAYLRFAHLEGVNLMDAELLGAYIVDAELQGAYLNRTNLQGALLIHTGLYGEYGLDTTSCWTQENFWGVAVTYDFTQLKDETWAQSKLVKAQLELAQQQVNTFKPSQELPTSITKEKFAASWLELLCKDDYVTKAMLGQLNDLNIEHPVTINQAKQYLNSQESCVSYRTILKDF